MLRQLVILFFGLALSFGCVAEQEDPPLAMEQMQYLLTEIHLANSVAYSHERNIEQQTQLKEDMVNQILVKAGLDRETFYRHYQYYIQHPELLDSVYSLIISDLEDRKKTVESAKEKQKSRR